MFTIKCRRQFGHASTSCTELRGERSSIGAFNPCNSLALADIITKRLAHSAYHTRCARIDTRTCGRTSGYRGRKYQVDGCTITYCTDYNFGSPNLFFADQNEALRQFCFGCFFDATGIDFTVRPKHQKQSCSENDDSGDDRQFLAVHLNIPHCAASRINSAAACPRSCWAAIRASRIASRASAALNTSINGKRPLR